MTSCPFSTKRPRGTGPARRRLSVRAHLAGAHALSLVAVAAMVVSTGTSIRQRERENVVAQLRIAARSTVQSVVSWFGPENSIGVLSDLASHPGVQALDAGQCDTVFATLSSQAGSGHLHLLGPDGAEVCSLRAPGLPATPLAPGPWFEQVRRTGEPVVAGTGDDPIGGQPAVTTAVPVAAADGRTGVLVLVGSTGSAPLPLPEDLPPDTGIVLLDAARRSVLATAGRAPVGVGAVMAAADRRPLGAGGSTVRDADGRRRISVELPADVAGSTWHVRAGVPVASVDRPATEQVARMALVGAICLAVVALIGWFLERRLARPIGRLERAIGRAAAGEPHARAPLHGPSELVRVAAVFNDLIDERRSREAELEYRATHDLLTGLPNRAAVTALLEEITGGAGRAGDRSAVLFLDLDRFKLINDSHGHSVGDVLLAELGRRLAAAAGDDAVVGRFGGDEFLAVAPAVHGGLDATCLADRLLATLEAPFEVGGRSLLVEASVGIALVAAGASVEGAIRDADTAMYRAKEQRSGRIAIFDSAMRERSQRRLAVEQDLHGALERDELRLHFQRIYGIAGDIEATGAEALVRWQHSTAGMVAPDEFIPVAEESGLIVPIGAWVLREATAWAAASPGEPSVSVNVSAVQLASRDLIDDVTVALEASGLPAGRLCLEVTETSLLRDPVQARETLAELRALGVRVAVDDFGTGQSSLAYLQDLPADVVKVDRSFVAGLGRDGARARIVEAVVSLSHALDLDVVAEGVETLEQLDLLRRMGCDGAQGYLLHRPEPGEALRRAAPVPFPAPYRRAGTPRA